MQVNIIVILNIHTTRQKRVTTTKHGARYLAQGSLWQLQQLSVIYPQTQIQAHSMVPF